MGQQEWQPVVIVLDKSGGSYSTPTGNEEGIFNYITHGAHPEGGDVVILYWQEKHGPLKGHTGIDTLWFQQRDRNIEVRGTFFLDDGSDYGEISSVNSSLHLRRKLSESVSLKK